MMFMKCLICSALLLVCHFAIDACSADDASPPDDKRLSELREIVHPARNRNLLLPSHAESPDLFDRFFYSRWRNSLKQAVTILVDSNSARDRTAGWDLAFAYGEPIGWTREQMAGFGNELDASAAASSVRAVSKTDPAVLGDLIEAILNNEHAPGLPKSSATISIPSVPDVAVRVRLWHMAAAMELDLRAECIYAYQSVSMSESTIPVMAGYLSDKSLVNVFVSNHFGRPVELRLLACQALSQARDHQGMVAKEILRRCDDDLGDSDADVEFYVASMIALQELNWESDLPGKRLVRLYHEKPESRVLVLQKLDGVSIATTELEPLIIREASNMSPAGKCAVCQWLSNQQSDGAQIKLKELMADEHCGVRLAASVAMSMIDPAFDLTPYRNVLLKQASTSPDEFALAFRDVDSAIASLALAGHSYSEAVQWLQSIDEPELQPIRDQGLEALSLHETVNLRGVLRRSAD